MVRSLMAGLVLTASLVACEPLDCIPTTTVAQDAAIVVAPTVARSGVLEAKLTFGDDEPLPEKQLTFTVPPSVADDGRLGSEDTSRRGVAELDLKDRPLRIPRAVEDDDYTASFEGDSKYCASSDAVALDIAHVR